MLKKAGIVAVAAAAGLLSLSPLAFATESHHQPHHPQRPANVDVTNIQHDNKSNDCNFAQDGGDARSSAFAGGGLLSILNPAVSAAAPITANLNALNCNNIDVSRLVNVGSENGNSSDNVSRTENSGNTIFGW
jgi:hypothetical protein